MYSPSVVLRDSPPARPLTKRYDYDSNNLIYEGWADANVESDVSRATPATSAAVWTIKKYTYSTNNIVIEQWSVPNQIWDNRATTVTYA